jgi:hypothetical protein
MIQLMLVLLLHPLLQVVWTTLTVGSSLIVALAVPDQAEKIYAVVGATAVCVVCYVIPVYIQLQMYRRSKQQQKLQVRRLQDSSWCGAAAADDCPGNITTSRSAEAARPNMC